MRGSYPARAAIPRLFEENACLGQGPCSLPLWTCVSAIVLAVPRAFLVGPGPYRVKLVRLWYWQAGFGVLAPASVLGAFMHQWIDRPCWLVGGLIGKGLRAWL